MTVCCYLYAIVQTSCQVSNKPLCCASVSGSEMPAGNQLCIRINGSPQPNVASSRIFLCDLFCPVFLFAVNPRPHFIKLEPLAFQVTKHAILIIITDHAHF